MRFLHTSDWHVGKPIRSANRYLEYSRALEEVLAIAMDRAVDCVLMAGDLFDSLVPPPEAEAIVYEFFRRLADARIQAVVIGGNHDHPRRLNAIAPIAELAGIYVRGESLRPNEGGVVEVRSHRNSEIAQVATLPWVPERKAREWDSLMGSTGAHLLEYAEEIGRRLNDLSACLRSDVIRIIMAHIFVEDAEVGGPESGEREIHMGQTYVIPPNRLPESAQYIALGHLHLPQEAGLNAYYSGSLLQLDFGEARSAKGVNIVDITPRDHANVEFVPLTSIRQLRNIGTAKTGLTLDEIRALAGEVGDAYLKVFVKVDRPLPGLAEQVRELLPNAVDIVVQRIDERPDDDGRELQHLSAPALFSTYYHDTHNSEPRPELTALFNRLHEEVTSAAD